MEKLNFQQPLLQSLVQMINYTLKKFWGKKTIEKKIIINK